jgi:hypothetical protein
MKIILIVCLGAATASIGAGLWGLSAATAATVSISALKDNTIYSESGSVSNGAGDNIFAGKTVAGNERRALFFFPVSANLPSCVKVTAVTLTLHMSRTASGPKTVTLHKVLTDWGEGTSDATAQEGAGAAATTGDATWTFTFYNTSSWGSAGGDFVATASASQSVDAIGSYAWSGQQMIADVQAWADGPTTNFGWILIGDETVSGTAKRFDSRTNPTEADRPVLQIDYIDCTPTEPDTWGNIKSLYR